MFNISTPSVFSKIVDDCRVEILNVQSTQFTQHVEGRMLIAATFEDFDPGFAGNDLAVKRAIRTALEDLNDSPENVNDVFHAENINPGDISPMHLGNGKYIAIVDFRGALPYVPSDPRAMAVELGFQRSFSF